MLQQHLPDLEHVAKYGGDCETFRQLVDSFDGSTISKLNSQELETLEA
jgi:hypothetical protein